MIGFVIVAHAPLASAMLACAEHVFGAVPDAYAYDVPPREDVTQSFNALAKLVARADRGDGVLVMADLFGATPSNVAARVAAVSTARCVVLAGVNAPMLLRALTYRHLLLDDVVQRALSGATQGVLRIGSTPQQNQQIKKTDDALARYHHQQ